jgi:hypothetical protein
MSEVKRKKVKVEKEVVELKITLDAEFFDNMDKAKQQVAEARGYDISYGEYIEEAMNDLVKMVEDYSTKLYQASEIIKQQDAQLPLAPEEPEEEPEPGEPQPGEVPPELYAHIVKDEDKRTMYH